MLLSMPNTVIGQWECDLATERLRWSGGVYRLFDLPLGSEVARAPTVALYDPPSRIEMERLRAEAIGAGTGFTLDAMICSAFGVERWIRIVAQVERERGTAVRLYGTKQDVTQERALWGEQAPRLM